MHEKAARWRLDGMKLVQRVCVCYSKKSTIYSQYIINYVLFFGLHIIFSIFFYGCYIVFMQVFCHNITF